MQTASQRHTDPYDLPHPTSAPCPECDAPIVEDEMYGRRFQYCDVCLWPFDVDRKGIAEWDEDAWDVELWQPSEDEVAMLKAFEPEQPEDNEQTMEGAA